MSQPITSWQNFSLQQLVDWAAGYILVAVGRGDFRSAVDAMVRQAYSNGYKAKVKEIEDARHRRQRSAPRRSGRAKRRRA